MLLSVKAGNSVNIDALLVEAEDKLRMAGHMVRNESDPAVITALATYAGSCATLASCLLAHPRPTDEEAHQTVQDTLDAEMIPQ